MNSLVHLMRVLIPNTLIFSLTCGSYGYRSRTNASWFSSSKESQSHFKPCFCSSSVPTMFGSAWVSWYLRNLCLVSLGNCWNNVLKLCESGNCPASIVSKHFRYVSKASAERTTYGMPKCILPRAVACSCIISLASWNVIADWNISRTVARGETISILAMLASVLPLFLLRRFVFVFAAIKLCFGNGKNLPHCFTEIVRWGDWRRGNGFIHSSRPLLRRSRRPSWSINHSDARPM